jgi:hypothetical protein
MKRLLWLAALLPAIATSQGLSSAPPGIGGGKVLASFPLQTTGALIAEDANTVAHVYWNGSALVDTKGNSWTENGTVPQVTVSPFTTTRYGAGPFSAANYYSLGTGADVLDFAGDFTVCVVFSMSTLTGQVLVSAGTYSGAGEGWSIGIIGATGAVDFATLAAGSSYTSSSTGNAAPAAPGPNVACVGRVGTNQYAKLNAGSTATAANAKNTPAVNTASMIGRRGEGAAAIGAHVYEVYATSTAFSEATVTAIQQKVLGHFDGSSALAVTRATNATYENPAGTVWTAAPGVARITSDGLLVEPARTKYVLNSTTHPKAAEATGALPTGVYYARHTGGGTMTITAGTATITGLACTTVAVGTPCTFTVTVTGNALITTTAGATRAQIEIGTYATSWIDTAGTAVVRNADAVSATVPAVPSKGWCISGNWKPTSAWPNALSLWTLGDTYNAANRASSWGNSSLYIVDAASGTKDLGAYTTPVAPWKIVTCNTAGALSLSVNGALVDSTSTGAGTGILTTPATTLHFGAQASAGTISDWYIKNVKIWAAKSTKEASK